MMTFASFLNQRLVVAALRVKHLPVASIDVTVGPPASYVINYKPGATPAQQAEAAAIVASIDWGTSFPDGMLNGAERAELWEHDFFMVWADTSTSMQNMNDFLKLYPVVLIAARHGYWWVVREWINFSYDNAGTGDILFESLRDALLAITPTDAAPATPTPPVTLTMAL